MPPVIRPYAPVSLVTRRRQNKPRGFGGWEAFINLAKLGVSHHTSGRVCVFPWEKRIEALWPIVAHRSPGAPSLATARLSMTWNAIGVVPQRHGGPAPMTWVAARPSDVGSSTSGATSHRATNVQNLDDQISRANEPTCSSVKVWPSGNATWTIYYDDLCWPSGSATWTTCCTTSSDGARTSRFIGR